MATTDLLKLTNYYDLCSVQQLNLSHCNIHGLSTTLQQCTNLECLDLSNNSNIDVSQLNILSKLPNLRTLNLSHCRITQYSRLPQIPSLTHLQLVNSTHSVTTDDICILAQKFSNLENLVLYSFNHFKPIDSAYIALQQKCIELWPTLTMLNNIPINNHTFDTFNELQNQLTDSHITATNNQHLYSAATIALSHCIQKEMDKLQTDTSTTSDMSKYVVDQSNVQQAVRDFHSEIDKVNQLIEAHSGAITV